MPRAFEQLQEQRRKAELLAKIRDVEEAEVKPTLDGVKPLENGAAMRKLLGNGTLVGSSFNKQDRILKADPKVSPALVSPFHNTFVKIPSGEKYLVTCSFYVLKENSVRYEAVEHLALNMCALYVRT